MSGAGGADTVILYDVCQAASGKTLDGGSGSDTLIIPIALNQLKALGVSVTGFETVTVDASKRYLADCF